jgi:hypothetical protein
MELRAPTEISAMIEIIREVSGGRKSTPEIQPPLLSVEV